MSNPMPSGKAQAQIWHSLSPQDVLHRLQVAEQGLTFQEAASRLAQYGPNQLVEAPRPGFWAVLWGQINNFVVWLLVVASVVSAALGDFAESAAILAIVVLNAVLGMIQERRAEAALAALRKLAAPDAQVLREGKRVVIPAGEIVPGDLVYLEAGNFVPADLRLLEAVNLRVEEASLTGESLPVEKSATLQLAPDAPLGDRKNTAFMGTTVVYGRGRGVVTSTGMHTQLGLIAAMLQAVESEETPLQRRLDGLGKVLSIGALLLVAIVFLVALLHSTEISLLFSRPGEYFQSYGKEVTEVFIIAVSLAIAAVPEGLPAVVTISLALGMREMIRRHALIRKLASVETLGSTTTICSDKTGTLTQNEMTVTRLWVDGRFIEVTGAGYEPRGEFRLDGKTVEIRDYPGALTALWLGVINNDAEIEVGSEASQRTIRVIGDPTEAALIVAAEKAGAVHQELDRAYPREQEIPFDSERKRMVTVHSIVDPDPGAPSPFAMEAGRDWDLIAVKGAPDVVLKLCTYYQTVDDRQEPLDDAARRRILDANDAMTRDALRALGVAYRVEKEAPLEALSAAHVERELVFVGLLGMIDPPREEVKPALRQAAGAGIRTVMITGDYPNTAGAIAEAIGLLQPGHRIMTGAELDALSEPELRRAVQEADVFARVSPEHKLLIVDALQANGQVVAMTGDGVNDAPAIKRADIGVAMGITGTDVAKETADMVLTDDNYASIVAAVEQGRIIYSNIRKFVFFLLSSNVAEIMIIFLATLAGFPSPLTAIQLLWLNLVTDGAPALALAMEKGHADIMRHTPRPKHEPIINRTMRTGIIVQTFAQTGAVLAAFGLGLGWELQAEGLILPGAGPWGELFQRDWRGMDLVIPQTMAFLTLSLCELFRAYTVRSERASIFSIGVFSNRFMQYAVGLSILLILMVMTVPFFQPIFNTRFLEPGAWAVVLGLALIPAAAEELTKVFLRRGAEG